MSDAPFPFALRITRPDWATAIVQPVPVEDEAEARRWADDAQRGRPGATVVLWNLRTQRPVYTPTQLKGGHL